MKLHHCSSLCLHCTHKNNLPLALHKEPKIHQHCVPADGVQLKLCTQLHQGSCDSIVGTVTTLWGGQSRVDFQLGQGISFFSKTSGPALGPTQPPIQWTMEVISLEMKWLEHKADHSPPSIAKIKKEQNWTSSPTICLYNTASCSILYFEYYYCYSKPYCHILLSLADS